MGGRNGVARSGEVQSDPRDDHTTPDLVLDLVRDVFGGEIGLDPCGNPDSIVAARTTYMLQDNAGRAVNGILPNGRERFPWIEIADGLKTPWGRTTAFVNPPYNRWANPRWAKRILAAGAQEGTELIALVPSSPGTRWWRPYRWGTVCFWDGRIAFGGAATKADFENAVVYFGPRQGRFREVFKKVGWIP